MVTDQQVRRLIELMSDEKNKDIAASKAGMSRRTAYKYRKAKKLPSQIRADHSWRTRQDPFEADWERIKRFLGLNAGLEAKTIFDYLQHRYPGKFSDGHLRTFRRKVKLWRAAEGPSKEVFFSQVHRPGYLCRSDFT